MRFADRSLRPLGYRARTVIAAKITLKISEVIVEVKCEIRDILEKVAVFESLSFLNTNLRIERINLAAMMVNRIKSALWWLCHPIKIPSN